MFDLECAACCTLCFPELTPHFLWARLNPPLQKDCWHLSPLVFLPPFWWEITIRADRSRNTSCMSSLSSTNPCLSCVVFGFLDIIPVGCDDMNSPKRPLVSGKSALWLKTSLTGQDLNFQTITEAVKKFAKIFANLCTCNWGNNPSLYSLCANYSTGTVPDEKLSLEEMGRHHYLS